MGQPDLAVQVAATQAAAAQTGAVLDAAGKMA